MRRNGSVGHISAMIRNEKHKLTRMLELPSDNVVPLIKLQRQVSVALDPLGII